MANLFTDKLRTVRLRGQHRWTVHTYATTRSDHRGQTGIAWRILCDGRLVDQSKGVHDLVYGSPLHADDADKTVFSVITLVCHDRTHDADGLAIECAWDTEDLETGAMLRWNE